MAALSEEEAAELLYDWHYWARPSQLPPPGDWLTWLILAGRGWGKTRTGAEWCRMKVIKGFKFGAMIGRTAADVRDTMVGGPSGILSVCSPWFTPTYEPSKKKVTFPNGATILLYSADEPSSLRGPQFEFAWLDEMAWWRYQDTLDNLQFGMRQGTHPQMVVTTTPRPVKWLKDTLNDPYTVTTKGNTYANAANLAPSFFRQILSKYRGTRLGRQEIFGDILDDNPDALWTRQNIDKYRMNRLPVPMEEIIIGVDPPGESTEEKHAEAGIVAAGRARIGDYDHFFVLDDYSLQGSPRKWGGQAIAAYNKTRADLIVGEKNYGGEMVENTIRTVPGGRNVPFKPVSATRGKEVRAQPVASLYEQGRVHHIGIFAELEDEMVEWMPNKGMRSPNRLDGAVWSITELMREEDEELLHVY